MPMTSKMRSTLVTLIAGAVASFSPASFAALSKFIQIDGASQEIVLEENTRLTLPDHADRHYRGHLKAFPESWVSLSRIGGEWEGLVSHQQRLYLINQVADTATQASTSRFTASALASDNLDLGTCGVAHAPILGSRTAPAAALTPQALVSKAISVNFSDYCDDTLDGVCLVADLSLMFDTKFRQAFPSDYDSRANTILNTLDTFYINELNISFKQLTVDFTHSSTFTSSEDPGDILEDMYEKRYDDRTTAFDPNKQSIFHLVTGRDFNYDGDESVVGLAFGPDYSGYPSFEPILCDSGGAAVSTAQVVYNGSQASSTLTALVVIHEVGHNFGAEHDAVPGLGASCTDTTAIMYPSLQDGMDHFSDCSKDTIAENISALNTVEACFSFPVDAGISASGSNATQVSAASSALTLNFTVSLETANSQDSGLQVTGRFTQGDGTFSSVSLAGSSCTLSNGNQTYTCSPADLGSSSALVVNLQTGTGNVGITHQVAPGSSSSLHDIDDDNDSTSSSIRLLAAGLPPGQLTGSYSRDDARVNLSWQDHSTNEGQFVLERRTGSGLWEVLDNAVAANTESYQDTRITAETTYSYRVSALFDGVQSAPSDEFTLTTTDVNRGVERFSGGGGGGGSLPLIGLIALAGWASLRRRRN